MVENQSIPIVFFMSQRVNEAYASPLTTMKGILVDNPREYFNTKRIATPARVEPTMYSKLRTGYKPFTLLSKYFANHGR